MTITMCTACTNVMQVERAGMGWGGGGCQLHVYKLASFPDVEKIRDPWNKAIVKLTYLG